MKAVTRYKTNDGSLFDDEDKAIAHEALCDKIDAVMAPLPPVPEEVERGKGWAQHDPEKVLTARDGILDICREQKLDEHYPVFKNRGRDVHPMSVVGRILDDVGGPLNRAWSRFCRIDDQGREHQQPYFAINKPDSDHKCIVDFTH